MASDPSVTTSRPSAGGGKRQQLDLWLPSLISLCAIAMGVIVILARSTINRPVALACALGFLCVGILVGFLFGIPKVVQAQGEAAVTTPEGAGVDRPRDERSVVYRMQVNTNLEQISDWLSKIIVGVGLVELKQLPEALTRLAAYIQPGIGTGDEARVLAMAIILYSSLVGFFVGYLVTRTYIAGVFRRADQLNTMPELDVGGESVPLDEAERLKVTIIEDLQEHVARLEDRLQAPLSAAAPATAAAAAPGPGPGPGPVPVLDGAEAAVRERSLPRDREGAGILRSRAVAPAKQLPRCILWVDDEPENNRYHIAFLRRRGVQVVTATSTAEAVGELKRGTFDIVISDSTRSENGRLNRAAALELLQAMRELEPNLPLYIYTRPETAPSIVERARAAGAAAVLSSPTDLLRALHIDSA
ncbi:MAG: response regulator [Polyangia bacterium]